MTINLIQIGIDLGTTNSSVSISKNGNVEIIKNAERDEYTPSVFGIDKSNNKIVGKRAYDKLFQLAHEEDVKNYVAEVKRLMGTSEGHYFGRLDKTLKPEEISAEILKYLKESILKVYPDFNTTAAVITIPAYFSVLEAEATSRAGNLAGFDYVVLLQEPIAAAIAYGFQNSRNEKWLVYDLGGGTFDVALISSEDGVLSVKGHAGDNYLGGKDFDWLIVDKIIVPKLLENYQLVDFNRANLKYKSIFSKLKYYAETAKKYLSQDKNTVIEVDGIGTDNQGKEIYLTIDITRDNFEALIEPLVAKTIELSKVTIKNSGIKESAINKIVLVGGPTQIPYIRRRLEKELKIEVDTSVDPLTVVSKGATIYASSQRIPSLTESADIQNNKQNIGGCELILNYEPMTSSSEELISGIIKNLEQEKEYYVQIQSENNYFTSPKISIKNGKFICNIAIEEKKTNLYWIYLFDNNGNSIPIKPDSFSITHGLSISGAPIPHSIGVAIVKKDLASNFICREIFDPFFEKGSVLPLEKTKTYFTSRILKKGDSENVLPIKLYEGESFIPDRNTFICDLEITGEKIPYDLSDNTEIEITIKVNKSREVKVFAFIPSVDLSIEARSTVYDEAVDVSKLESELLIQNDRFLKIERICNAQEKAKIEETFQTVSRSIRNARTDEDEKRRANKFIRDLKVTIDTLEDEKEIPQLIDEYNDEVMRAEKTIETLAKEENKTKYYEELKALKKEGEVAIKNNDKNILGRTVEQLQTLSNTIFYSHPYSMVYLFKDLTNGKYSFTNKDDANYYLEKGKKALENDDIEELERCTRNLLALLPQDVQESFNEEKRKLSGIQRKEEMHSG